jgi:hypothetical protein
MGSQKAKQKRTAKHKSTRTGRPKVPSTPNPPLAAKPRPRPIPNYRGAAELLGPGQPGDGGRIERVHSDDSLCWGNSAGLSSLPVISEEDEGDDEPRVYKPNESDMEDDEESEEEDEEPESDIDEASA